MQMFKKIDVQKLDVQLQMFKNLDITASNIQIIENKSVLTIQLTAIL